VPKRKTHIHFQKNTAENTSTPEVKLQAMFTCTEIVNTRLSFLSCVCGRWFNAIRFNHVSYLR
jgi:hypothetical protein